jgi:hypothetical protein
MWPQCFSQKASAHNRGATQHAANAGSDSFDVRPCESLRTCRAAAPVIGLVQSRTAIRMVKRVWSRTLIRRGRVLQHARELARTGKSTRITSRS